MIYYDNIYIYYFVFFRVPQNLMLKPKKIPIAPRPPKNSQHRFETDPLRERQVMPRGLMDQVERPGRGDLLRDI